MVELDLKKITAPDFSVSIRPGLPSLMVIDEAAVPSIYWQPSAPKLKRQELLTELKEWHGNRGRCPLQSRAHSQCPGAVMGFSARQLLALRRKLDGRQVRTRQANGRELSYIEGWYAISEANRIFGFDGWSRETVESRCVLARENHGAFIAVYIAKVRITVEADGATIVREGHGSGQGRGPSPGEVHDIALKAAETDATKRALATFGKPFGLELYRHSRAPDVVLGTTSIIPTTRFGSHPDDTTPIPRPSHYYGSRQGPSLKEQFTELASSAPPDRAGYASPYQKRSTKVFWRYLNRSAVAINRIYALSPPSPAWSADATPVTLIMYVLRSRAHWGSKSAMNSPFRSAAVTIASFIKAAMKSPGGRK